MKWPSHNPLSDYVNNNLNIYKDWPKPGINYLNTVDICRDFDLFKVTVDWYSQVATHVDASALFAADARGFLWSAPVAVQNKIPLHVVRKKGKMPGELLSREYQLEYGTDVLEIAKIDKPPGKVLIIDDELATGGTAEAICKLLHDGLGIEYKDIELAVLLNLTFLPGEKVLNDLGVAVKNLINVN